MDSELHVLDDPNPGIPCPGIHAPVAFIRPAVPCFLMDADRRDLVFGAEFGQDIHRIADAEHQRLSECRQVTVETGQAFAKEVVMAARHVGLLPELRLQNIERNHRTCRRRGGKRRIIFNAQVSLEPDDLHDVPLLYLWSR